MLYFGFGRTSESLRLLFLAFQGGQTSAKLTEDVLKARRDVEVPSTKLTEDVLNARRDVEVPSTKLTEGLEGCF